jgi:hypothetical protein
MPFSNTRLNYRYLDCNDLTDSTVLRNIGVPIGHTIIGFEATLKGPNKLLH